MSILINFVIAIFFFWFSKKQTDKTWSLIFFGIAVAFLVTTISSAARADSLNLTTLSYSYHYDRNYDYNEEHGGVGIEYETDSLTYGFLHYKNSFNADSDAIYVVKSWVFFGLANGYEDASGVKIGDDVLVLLGASVDVELVDNLDLNFLITPSVTATGINYSIPIE